jgi:hypothetical protein
LVVAPNPDVNKFIVLEIASVGEVHRPGACRRERHDRLVGVRLRRRLHHDDEDCPARYRRRHLQPCRMGVLGSGRPEEYGGAVLHDRPTTPLGEVMVSVRRLARGMAAGSQTSRKLGVRSSGWIRQFATCDCPRAVNRICP